MLNNICLMGRLVADPEKRTTAAGREVCCFRLAVDRDYKTKDGERPTDFFNVVVWGSMADFFAGKLGKGELIALEGSMESHSYTDKDGNKRLGWEVLPSRIHFAGGKKTEKKEGSENERYSEEKGIANSDGDMPF